VVDLLRNGQAVFAIAVDKVWDDIEGSIGAGTTAKSRAAAGGS
jgi:hypothetical protein